MRHQTISSIAFRLAALMKRPGRASALGRWALVGAAASALGCASDLQPLNVTAFYPLASADGVCLPTTTTPLVKGIYDVNRRGPSDSYPGYVVGISVKSDLTGTVTQPNSADPTPVRIPTNTAQLTSLTAKYTWSPAEKGTPTVTLEEKTFPISSAVEPGSTSSFPAQILANTKEVNAALAKGKSGTLTVEVTMSGVLQSGSSISTTPAFFSIGVCSDDCVPDCADSETLSLPCGAEAAAQPDGRVCEQPTTP